MSKRTTYSLEELRRRAADRRGGDALTITAGGKPFTIPAPGFWDDSLKEAAQQTRQTGDVPFARQLMGEAQYEKFTAAGGRADDLLLIIEEYRADQGVESLGESGPSPTS
ncbi:hypothetical protein RM844_30355 [Streptomyces sp. DSM 44915]|uniref:Uncharacterized protein n=1 Tax=Streptomyces chisholmiae TaxID=3075540 RepID=A0ABU2K030_9ACTN|nr:hypothetical protein [Streptomyces sp. DSM 44915]MDT0270584.1 hypothetical protein [Streptomyces sp. DSM 44915]